MYNNCIKHVINFWKRYTESIGCIRRSKRKRKRKRKKAIVQDLVFGKACFSLNRGTNNDRMRMRSSACACARKAHAHRVWRRNTCASFRASSAWHYFLTSATRIVSTMPKREGWVNFHGRRDGRSRRVEVSCLINGSSVRRKWMHDAGIPLFCQWHAFLFDHAAFPFRLFHI